LVAQLLNSARIITSPKPPENGTAATAAATAAGALQAPRKHSQIVAQPSAPPQSAQRRKTTT
jgi:hypothetical protein